MSEALQEASKTVAISLQSIEAAASRIKPHIHKTPILTSRLVDEYLNEPLSTSTHFFFKAENLQKTGSFKIRGALNALAALDTPQSRPVVTHSSGNHAAALASASAVHGRSAYIVIPVTAPDSKVDAVRGYGGLVERCGPTYEDRERTAEEVCERVRGTLIHPFLNPYVVAGQGTVGLEIVEQVRDLDGIIIPIGGGGLIAGITLALKSVKPEVVVIGAEPALACAAARSLAAGKRVCDSGAAKTVADGVKSGVGGIGWEVLRRLVNTIVVVEEEEILEGMKMVWTRMKTVVEGAAGVSVAAARKIGGMGLKKVVVVLCGGNVEFKNLPW